MDAAHAKPHAVLAAAELVATYGLPAFILCLPLEFTGALIHVQISRLVLAGVAAALLVLMFARRRPMVIPKTASALVLGLYVAAAAISWLLARRTASTSSILDILLYPIVGLVIFNVVRSQADHKRAWIALLVSGLGVAILGAIVYVTGVQIWTPNPSVANRANITFGDPNITARFLTLCAAAAVLMFAARRGPTWLTLAALLACAAVVPLTYSRSGLILFIATAVLAFAVALDRRRAAACVALGLAVFALSTVANPDTRLRAEQTAWTAESLVTHTKPHSTSSAHTAQDPSALSDNRVYLIGAGLKMFEDHPITGVGFGGYQNSLLTTYARFLPHDYTDSVSHTSFITVLAEQGLVGAALFLLFLILLALESLKARWRRGSWSVWTTLASTLIVPILLYSQFEARFFSEPYLWLALGMLYSAERLSRRQAGARTTIRPITEAAAA